MDDYIKTYTLRCKLLGPVFIGSGETVGKKEYVYNPQRGLLYIMDMKRLFRGLQQRGLLDAYEGFLMNPAEKNLGQFLRRQRIREDEVQKWASYALKMRDIDTGNGIFNEIHSFMKDAYGCPYIPGSSMKGAIRTAIEGVILNGNGSVKSIVTAKEHVIQDQTYGRKRWRDQDAELSRKVFHTIKRPESVPAKSMLRDKMAGIRVSDSKPLSVSDLVLCQKIDEKRDGSMSNLSVYRECLKPGTEVTFDLEIDRQLYNTTGSKIEAQIRKSYSLYEQMFLSKFSQPGQKGKNTLLLGGGAGYPSKAVMYELVGEDTAVRLLSGFFSETTPRQHKHRDDVRTWKLSPHTRKRTKIDGKLYDMGVCSVEITEK